MHESLLKAGILHRDISIGNIMLTENEEDGFLIDLDLVVRISDDHTSDAPIKTGTKESWEVDRIVDKDGDRYLVRWKGWSPAHDQ